MTPWQLAIGVALILASLVLLLDARRRRREVRRRRPKVDPRIQRRRFGS